MINLHIQDSYRIPKADFGWYLDTLSDHEIFGYRSKFSLCMEWAVHNALYHLGICRERTASVDLNHPCRWEWLYVVLGVIVWIFIP